MTSPHIMPILHPMQGEISMSLTCTFFAADPVELAGSKTVSVLREHRNRIS